MSVWMALVWIGGTDLPIELQWEEKSRVHAFLQVRAGAWYSDDFEFEATRPDSTFVSSKETTLASAGVDLGIQISDHYVILLTYESLFANDISGDLAGLTVGYRDKAKPGAAPAVPHEVTVYAGAFWSRLEVEEPGFGDFDDAFGLRAGLAFTWFAARAVGISVLGEYRLVEYDYEDSVSSGSDTLGGSGAWVGLGVDLRL